MKSATERRAFVKNGKLTLNLLCCLFMAEHLTRPSLKMVSQDKDNVASKRVKNHFVWVRHVFAETGRCQYKCFKEKRMSIQTGLPTKCNVYKKVSFFSFRKVDWYQRKDEKVINDIFKISILWIHDTWTSQITRRFCPMKYSGNYVHSWCW